MFRKSLGRLVSRVIWDCLRWMSKDWNPPICVRPLPGKLSAEGFQVLRTRLAVPARRPPSDDEGSIDGRGLVSFGGAQVVTVQPVEWFATNGW